jgi:hypothetical protein
MIQVHKLQVQVQITSQVQVRDQVQIILVQFHKSKFKGLELAFQARGDVSI